MTNIKAFKLSPKSISGASVIIILLGVSIYSNSIQAPFVFDDIPAIVGNASIRCFTPLFDPLHPPPCIGGRPLTNMTLALNHAISGENVWSYHLFNLLIHILAALTLFGIIRRTLISGNLYEKFGERATLMALLCSLVWMSHPLQTQAVTYVIQRCEALMGLMIFLTLYCSIRGWQKASSKLWHFAAVLICFAGMGAKESMVVAPLLVFFYDYVFVHTNIHDIFKRSKRLYLGLIASLLFMAGLVTVYGTQNLGRENLAYTPLAYALTQSQIIFHYLGLAAWPAKLTFYYDWPIADPLIEMLPYAAALLLAIGVSIKWLIQRNPWSYIAIWFFITIGATSSLIPIKDLVFEHRMYLPLASLAVCFVLAVCTITDLITGRMSSMDTELARSIAYLFCMIVIILLGVRTFDRNSDYQSRLSIWKDTVAKQPHNGKAYTSLGNALLGKDRMEEAMDHLQTALAIQPRQARAYNNIGVIYLKQRKWDHALNYFQKAIGMQPDYASPHANIGSLLALMGKPSESISHFERALEINPHYGHAHYNLGQALMETGKPEPAIHHFQHALYMHKDFINARFELGLALMDIGEYSKAIGTFTQVIDQNPHLTGAYLQLANAHLKISQFNQAIEAYRKALAIKPDDAEAYNGMGIALAQTGQIDRALIALRRALAIDPNHQLARKNIDILKQYQNKRP